MLELPWSFAYRTGFTEQSPGLFYRYFATRAEAIKARNVLIQNKKYAGEIENRPNESWRLR